MCICAHVLEAHGYGSNVAVLLETGGNAEQCSTLFRSGKHNKEQENLQNIANMGEILNTFRTRCYFDKKRGQKSTKPAGCDVR